MDNTCQITLFVFLCLQGCTSCRTCSLWWDRITCGQHLTNNTVRISVSTGVHIVQDLQFMVGQDKTAAVAAVPDGTPVATISKVSRGHIAPQQFTSVREWFSYAFSSTEKGERLGQAALGDSILFEGHWHGPTLLILSIIMLSIDSFMCCLSKLEHAAPCETKNQNTFRKQNEHIAHYKAKNQNTFRKQNEHIAHYTAKNQYTFRKEAHACTHACIYSHTHMLACTHTTQTHTHTPQHAHTCTHTVSRIAWRGDMQEDLLLMRNRGNPSCHQQDWFAFLPSLAYRCWGVPWNQARDCRESSGDPEEPQVADVQPRDGDHLRPPRPLHEPEVHSLPGQARARARRWV